jgi:hypothetical protein
LSGPGPGVRVAACVPLSFNEHVVELDARSLGVLQAGGVLRVRVYCQRAAAAGEVCRPVVEIVAGLRGDCNG